MCVVCNQNNCNCNTCQECNNSCPTQTCVTTCTCTSDKFSDDCPCGQVGTNCIVYTGDDLLECDDDLFYGRGGSFNTLLLNMWNYVKCAAAPTTDTTDYVGANLRNCADDTTIVATGTSVTVALTTIWNYIKCWLSDTQDLIDERQPIWLGSNPVLVGSSQTAPFDDINTALEEIAKYHYNDLNPLIILLEEETHTVNNEYLLSYNPQAADYLIMGDGTLTTLVSSKGYFTADSGTKINLSNLQIESRLECFKNSSIWLTNCAVTNLADASVVSIWASDNSNIFIKDCFFVDSSPPEFYNNTVAKAENNSNIYFSITDEVLQAGFFTNGYSQLFSVQNGAKITLDFTTAIVINGVTNGAYIIDVKNDSQLNIISESGLFTVLGSANQGFLSVKNNSSAILCSSESIGYNVPISCSNGSSILLNGDSDFTDVQGGIIVSENSSLLSIGAIDMNNVATVPTNDYYLNSTNNSKITLYADFMGTTVNPITYKYQTTRNSNIILKDSVTSPIPDVTNCFVGAGALAPNTLVTSGVGTGCVINYE